MVELHDPQLDQNLNPGFEPGLNGFTVRFWLTDSPRRSSGGAGQIHIETFGPVGCPGNSNAYSSGYWSDDFDFENHDFSEVIEEAAIAIRLAEKSDEGLQGRRQMWRDRMSWKLNRYFDEHKMSASVTAES